MQRRRYDQRHHHQQSNFSKKSAQWLIFSFQKNFPQRMHSRVDETIKSTSSSAINGGII